MHFNLAFISLALQILSFTGLNLVYAQNCNTTNCDILSTCPTNSTCLNGVNLQALIYNSGNFVWKGQSPTEGDVSLYKGYGFNTVRYGFLWELLQPDLSQGWDQVYLSIMVSNVTEMVKAGMVVILDCHNYGNYFGRQIGGPDPKAPTAADYATMWSTLAQNFIMPQVMFGLMNEPTDQYDPATLQNTLQTVVNALREVIPKNQYILLPSNHWQGIESFMSTSNYTLAIKDSGNSLIDIHNYFDHHGGTQDCTDFQANWETHYTAVTNLLSQNKRRAIVTEIGGRAFPDCVASISQALSFMDNHSDVWVGYTAWGAEEAQPENKCQSFNASDDSSSVTAFFIDCTNGDLVNKAFVNHGIIPSVYDNSCCQPGRDSIASFPQNLTLQCNPNENLNLQCLNTTQSSLSLSILSYFYPSLLLTIFIPPFIWLLM